MAKYSLIPRAPFMEPTREVYQELARLRPKLLGPIVAQVLKKSTKEVSLEDRMTSELVYLSSSLGDKFGREYKKRLGLINFNPEDIRNLYDQEKITLEKDQEMIHQRYVQWVIREDLTLAPPKIPNPSLLTLSELILITNNENIEELENCGVNQARAWQALHALANQNDNGAIYSQVYDLRTDTLRFSNSQKRAFAGKAVKGYNNNRVWTSESTNLADYKN